MELTRLINIMQEKNIRLALDEKGGLKLRADKTSITPELLAAIKQHKSTLMLQLQQNCHTTALSVADKSLVPITKQQHSLWLQCQAQGDNPAYHMPLALIIKPLSSTQLVIFLQVLNAQINKQALLHYQFIESNNQVLMQKKEHHEILVSLEEEVLSGDSEHLFKTCKHWFSKPFNLHKDDLFRCAMHKIDEHNQDSYLLLINIHHIIWDGASNALFLKSLLEQYQQSINGNSSTEKPEPQRLDYLDYALWQQQYLSEQASQEELQAFASSLYQTAPLNLTDASIHHSHRTDGTAHHTIILNDNTLDKLQQCSQSLQISRFSLLLSCWQITLAKLSQQSQFMLAMPINNRSDSRWQQCSGLMVNTLAIKSDIQHNASVLQLLNHNQQWIIQQLQNSELPLSAVIEKLNNNPQHDLSVLFQAAINYENINELERLQNRIKDTINIESLDFFPQQAKFPLSLNISDGQHLQLILEYQQQHYSESFIQTVASVFDQVLQQMVNKPQSTIAQIQLLNANNKNALLGLGDTNEEKNLSPLYAAINRQQHTQTPIDTKTNVAWLIQQQVQRSPTAIACSIIENGILKQCSYDELNHASDILAFELEHTTARVIGVLMPRSLELSIVLLAILKSGNAYCVLHADIEDITERGHHQQRIQQIINDAKITQVFCQQKNIDSLHRLFADEVVLIAADNRIANRQLTASEKISAEEKTHSDLFNITYTSGSTGKPKGVRVLQQGIINRLQWMQKTSSLSRTDVVLQKTPISFDVSVWELFWPLLYGARLHFAAVDEHKDPLALLHTIRTQQVSHLHFVPAMLNFFLQQCPADEIKSLTSVKAIYLSGEAADKNGIEQLFTLQPEIDIFNLYGPTEASIDVSYYACDRHTIDKIETVPIGQPIDNHQLFILDQHLQVLPAGLSGELYIAGIGLAEGYQDSTLDKNNFIENPYYLDGSPWPRLYKTGDICYYNQTGALCYLSRNDDQIKLRGVRIELSEIKQCLLQYPNISQVQVIIDKEADKILAFYQADRLYEAAQLRDYLLNFLPVAYTPHQFIALDQWPNTLHGKLDVKFLIQFAKKQKSAWEFNSKNSTEKYLQKLWQTLLQQQPLPCNISFFELGGHSLLASQMLQTVASEKNIALNFRHIFDYPSISQLSAFIKQQQKINTDVAQLIPLPEQESYVLSRQQAYLYQWQNFNPDNTAYHMPSTFFVEGQLNVSSLENAINHLLKQQKVLSSVYSKNAESLQQRPLKDIRYHLEVKSIEATVDKAFLAQWISTDVPAEEVATTDDKTQKLQYAIHQHREKAFDLSLDIPIRFKVFKTAKDQAIISMVVHHIAADALSLELIFSQLQALYLAEKATTVCDVTPAIQYHDYSVWQSQRHSSKEAGKFWQQQLNHAPLYTHLPKDNVADNEKSTINNPLSHFIRRTLSQQQSNKITAFCQQLHISPYIFLLSFYQLLLIKLGQSESVCVGITSNARTEQQLNRCIGYFVNSLLARADIQKQPDTRQFLQQQKQQLLSIWQYQDIDLQTLWQHSKNKTVSQASGALCSFNYLQQADKNIDHNRWADLKVTAIDSLYAMSKFDLCMHVYEEAQQFSLLIEFNTTQFSASDIQSYLDKYLFLLEQGMENTELSVQHLALQDPQSQQQEFTKSLINNTPFHQGDIDKIYPVTAMQKDILINAQMDQNNRQNYLGFVSWVEHKIDPLQWQQAIYEIIASSDILNTLLLSPDNNSHYINVQLHAKSQLAYNNYSHVDFTDIDFDEHAALTFSDQLIYRPYTQPYQPFWRAQLIEFADHTFMFVLCCHHALMDGISLQLLGDRIKCLYEENQQPSSQPIPLFEHGFSSFAEQQRFKTDNCASQQYWEQVSAELTFSPHLITDDNSAFMQQTFAWEGDELLNLLQHCKRQRTTVANYLKSLYAVALQQTIGLADNTDFLIHDVVSGRDKNQLNQLGLFFDIQPNLISLKKDDDFNLFMRHLAKQRKVLNKVTPLSLAAQKRIFQLSQLLLFNFYVMETQTQFLQKSQQIRHFMPEQKQDISLICKLSADSLSLTLCANKAFLGDHFLQLIAELHQHFLCAKSSLLTHLSNTPSNKCFELVERDQNQEEQATNTALLADDSFTQAENNTEAELLRLWQNAFNREDISITADFFSLGGHSLLALQIQQQLQQRFAIDLPAEQFFQHNSIRQIAHYIIEQREQTTTVLAHIQPQHKKQAALSSAQMRLWFLCQDETANTAYNIPLAVRLPSTIETTLLKKALHLLLLKHPILRSQISVIDQQPILIEQSLPSDEIDRLIHEHDIHEENIKPYLHKESQTFFDLTDQFLIRIKIIHVSEEGDKNTTFDVLSICLHHIISDAQSMFILLRDLYTIYTQLQQSQALLHTQKSLTQQIKLALKTELQYSDFCLWQAEQTQLPTFQSAIDYWLDELQQAPLLLGLPYDKPRPNSLSFNGDSVHFSLDHQLQCQLQALAQTQGCSLFTLLLSSYQLLLNLISGQQDICIGIPNHGRQQPGLQNICGFFVNAIVIRANLQHNPSFSELLQQTQAKLSLALKHQHAPAEHVFQQWAHNANMPNQLNYMPIVQAAFNYLDVADNKDAKIMSDMGFEIYSNDFQTAKFELLLNIQRSEQDKLQASFEYNSDLFSSSSIEHFITLWQQLLVIICGVSDEKKTGLNKRLYQYQSEHLLSHRNRHQLPTADTIMPTSSIQRDLLLASTNDPTTLENSIGYALELPVNVNIEQFEYSLKKLYEHYPILSAQLETVHHYQQNQFYFLLNKNNIAFSIIDLSKKELSEKAIKKSITDLIYKPYDIYSDALLQHYLIKIDEQRFYTVLACHHALLDGLSFTLHAYHLVSNYLALGKGEAVNFTTNNYNAAIQTSLNTIDKPDTINYWKEQLQGCQPLSYTLADGLTPDQRDRNIATDSLKLSDSQYKQIRSFCKKQKITVAIYFKALYSLLIRFYCQSQDDFYISEFNNGRNKKQLGTMGCFFQRHLFIVPQQYISGDFATFLQKIKSQQRAQASLQNLSLLKQQEIITEPGLSFSYNYIYMPKSGEADGISFDGQSFSPQYKDNIDLRVQLDKGELTLYLSYQTSHFNNLDFLQRLLLISDQLIDDKDQLLNLEYRLEHEKETFENSLIDTATPTINVLTRIEQQAKQWPQEIAIIDNQQQLSYQQLLERSHKLAAFLINNGVNKSDVIAISTELNCDYLIIVLAVLKAGAAYCPIDTTLPQQRKQSYITNSNCRFVFTDQPIDCSIQQWASTDLTALSNTVSELNTMTWPQLLPEDNFYIIYTSGTTGTAKAVNVNQANVENLQRWYGPHFKFNQQDTHLIFTSIGFDLTQKNLFAPLLTGGKIVFSGQEYDPRHINQLIEKNNISIINAAPSAVYPILTSAKDNNFSLSSLRLLLLGGESITSSNLQALSALNSTVVLVNMYGPAECTDITTACEFNLQQLTDNPLLPLAKDKSDLCPGVTLSVVNDALQLQPPGFIGELIIEGATVSPGFVEKNISRYATGDMVYQAPGNREMFFYSRKDQQLNIRGHRVDRTEIIFHISQYLQRAGIAYSQIHIGYTEGCLIAYIESQNETGDHPHHFTAQTLINTLQGLLPSYAVPQKIMLVQQFPSNKNGKIDTSALWQGYLQQQALLPEYNLKPSAKTDTERTLLQCWKEQLQRRTQAKHSQIGIDDNFFTCGGDSLMAVNLVHHIEQQFSIKLPVSVFLQAQTIRLLADYIDNKNLTQQRLHLLQTQGSEAPIFSIHGLGGLVFNFYKLAQQLSQQPFYALQASGFNKGEVSFNQLDELIDDYFKLIDAEMIKNINGKKIRLMGFSFGGLIAHELALKLQDNGYKIEDIILLDSHYRSFKSHLLIDDASLIKIFIQQNFPELNPSLLLGLRRKIKKQGLGSVLEKLVQASDYRIDPDFILKSLEVMRGFIQISEGYPKHTSHFPITLIRAKQSLSFFTGKDNGWSALNANTNSIQTQMKHNEILNNPTLTAQYIIKNCKK